MDQTEGEIFLHDAEQRTVELGSTWLDYSELKPLGIILLHLLLVSIRDFELLVLDVDRLQVTKFDVV